MKVYAILALLVASSAIRINQLEAPTAEVDSGVEGQAPAESPKNETVVTPPQPTSEAIPGNGTVPVDQTRSG